jgi:hypothetical protein
MLGQDLDRRRVATMNGWCLPPANQDAIWVNCSTLCRACLGGRASGHARSTVAAEGFDCGKSHEWTRGDAVTRRTEHSRAGNGSRREKKETGGRCESGSGGVPAPNDVSQAPARKSRAA